MAALPDVPTPPRRAAAIRSVRLVRPAGAARDPKAIVAKLNHELAPPPRTCRAAEFLEVGAEPDVMSPEEAKKFISDETVNGATSSPRPASRRSIRA